MDMTPEQRKTFQNFGVRLRELLSQEFCLHDAELIHAAARASNFPEELAESLAQKFQCACKLVEQADAKIVPVKSRELKPEPPPDQRDVQERRRDAMFQAALRRAQENSKP